MPTFWKRGIHIKCRGEFVRTSSYERDVIDSRNEKETEHGEGMTQKALPLFPLPVLELCSRVAFEASPL